MWPGRNVLRFLVVCLHGPWRLLPRLLRRQRRLVSERSRRSCVDRHGSKPAKTAAFESDSFTRRRNGAFGYRTVYAWTACRGVYPTTWGIVFEYWGFSPVWTKGFSIWCRLGPVRLNCAVGLSPTNRHRPWHYLKTLQLPCVLPGAVEES